ncbi:hypothetical protein QR98_0013830 [Sarcoptes scabiei]|uniref:Uncharacterized protein n=1 Tax=Sarcoptes scabiei TaxID=52283 RepID=A0A131ZWC8_SARSC|nr:hypothetical protein QR98_0013830 [Sarcoptes scabiei]
MIVVEANKLSVGDRNAIIQNSSLRMHKFLFSASQCSILIGYSLETIGLTSNKVHSNSSIESIYRFSDRLEIV